MKIYLLFVLGIATSVMAFLAGVTISRINFLVKVDKVTGMASVQLLVVLTTALLVLRFLLDFFGPWYTNTTVNGIILSIEALNYSLVHYTMGLMQLLGTKVNDYFQVWAVLLVTLQYSVKIGRPYTRSKQIPLLDLMSSFWAANLIRMQTFFLLRIPLWLIWAVNAARIISYFASSDKAEAINQESIKLVADYMRYEHELSSCLARAHAADPSKDFTMKWYKYLVMGEDQALRDVQENDVNPAAQSPGRNHGIRLDPKHNKKLVTIDRIWEDVASHGGLLGNLAPAGPTSAQHLRDVCLSFSLYKQLRCRFYDLPIYEARLPAQMKKLRRLVFDYILKDSERAFRVAATELSFLQDLFYSKHAAIFANGFPTTNLVLSVLLMAATGYIAYPVRYIPGRMDKEDDNSITHGVFVTRFIIALIIGKELAEIYMYVFSQWSKVLMLCNYTKCPRPRPAVVRTAMRLTLHLMRSDRWNEEIRQRNLLISCRAVKIPGFTIIFPYNLHGGMKMKACTKEAIFKSLKKLEGNRQLGSYFSEAFGDEGDLEMRCKVGVLEADTHRILVWHIATSLCEIRLASEEASQLRPFLLLQRPFVNPETRNGGSEAAAGLWWEHYTTAASLSNYCAYLVTQGLVPDNGVVASKVIDEVCRELLHVTMNDGSIGSLLRLRSMEDVYARLMCTVSAAEQGRSRTQGHGLDINNSLTRMGAELASQLMAKYKEDKASLWEKLAVFWTGFLLHLAASTRASKHKTCLAGRQELATHLWALLSHAGFLGTTVHGEELLDPVDLSNANQVGE